MNKYLYFQTTWLQGWFVILYTECASVSIFVNTKQILVQEILRKD